jgi:DNA-binding transcriptional regulator GbsR (MarR family)
MTARAARAKEASPAETGEPSGWQRRFVEQVGVLAGDLGVARSLARVLAWLVVCEPRHQSADQIRTMLKMSTGSVSAATTALVGGGLAARRTFPGDRRTYYELRPDGWQRIIRVRLQQMTEMRHVVEEAIVAAPGRHNDRLQGMRDLYRELETMFIRILDDYAAAQIDGKAVGARPAARGATRRKRSTG